MLDHDWHVLPMLLFVPFHFSFCLYLNESFPGGLDGKPSVYNVGDLGSIPGSGRSPEKGMAAHSSILAWRIPWTEEPGGLQSMGLQRVGHGRVANTEWH